MEDLQSFKVKSNIHDYEVIFEDYKRCIADYNQGDAIIVDESLLDSIPIKKLDGIIVISVESKEINKEYTAVSKYIKQLIKHGFRRNNKIYAIGGGVIQDISGFVASIIYRGVEWCFIPTTLLAQGDSCIGGKTSINFDKYKNQIGNFYPPHKVVIDTYFLKSLPINQVTSGFGEMLHYFIIDGDESLDFFQSKYKKKDINSIVYKSLQIKKQMIQVDEFDKGPRLVFNYGHSFGHVIESITKYKTPHGIAVAHGMDMANFISWKLGFSDENNYKKLNKILTQFWGGDDIKNIMVDFYKSNDYFIDKFIELLKKDKKNTKTHLGLILCSKPGVVFKQNILPDKKIKNILKEYSEQK